MRDLVSQEHEAAVLGVDVGASTIAGGLVTAGGDVLASVQIPTHAGGHGSGLDGLMAVIAHLRRDAEAQGIRLRGIGVGLPGLVDIERGMIVSERHLLPELTGVPIADHIRRATGLPAYVDNDVNALALAEARYGEGRGVSLLVVLAMGTGVGGAMVIDGALVRGRSGYAGEFGHMTVDLRGPTCFVGIRGCACRFLSGGAIAELGRLHAAHQPDSKMVALAGGDLSAVTTQVVFGAAEAGDADAVRIVDDICETLGACLGSILNGLNPDVVVVTGGVVKSLLPLREEILQRLARYTLPDVLADSTIRFLTSDKSSSMRGAAALFLYESARRRDEPVPARTQER
jgi:predicted NBD/HSP70 family sugar kinase